MCRVKRGPFYLRGDFLDLEAEFDQLEEDVENIGQSGATIYTVTEIQTYITGSGFLKVFCNPGEMEIDGNVGPTVCVNSFYVADYKQRVHS